MSNSPKISVIIPVYNAEKYLRQCLDSVIGQTLENIEIICVDDGSTDNSSDILAEYARKDNRIVIIHQQNAGAGAARNKGLDQVKGKYISFLDADDFFKPDLLQKVVIQAEETRSDIIAINYYTYDDKTKKLTRKQGIRKYFLPDNLQIFNYKNVPDRILDIIDPVPWNKLFKTEFIRKSGLKFQEISSSNDIAFSSISLALANSISYIEEPLLYYRINTRDSISKAKPGNLDNVIKAVDYVYDYVSKLDYFEAIYKSVIYFMVNKYIYHLVSFAIKSDRTIFISYFQKIKALFNSNILSFIPYNDLDNYYLYVNYLEIRDGDPELYSRKCLKRNLKVKLKYTKDRFLKILPVSFAKFYSESYQFFLHFPKYFKLFNSHGLNKDEKREKKIIVSLTTIPNRINSVKFVLGSMLHQSVKPDRILLYLGEDKFKNVKLPWWLRQQQKCGVEIIYCKDIKPHKKYYYAMQKYSEDIVITVDDDIHYQNNLIEKLVNSYRKHPNAVSCLRSHLIRFNKNGDIESYNNWDNSYSAIVDKPSVQLFATGVGGILYPPHCMHEELFNEQNLIKLCLKADDIWLKIMQIMKNTPVVLVEPARYLNYIHGTQTETLRDQNVDQNQNDVQLNNILEVYNNYFGKDDTLINRLKQEFSYKG